MCIDSQAVLKDLFNHIQYSSIVEEFKYNINKVRFHNRVILVWISALKGALRNELVDIFAGRNQEGQLNCLC